MASWAFSLTAGSLGSQWEGQTLPEPGQHVEDLLRSLTVATVLPGIPGSPALISGFLANRLTLGHRNRGPRYLLWLKLDAYRL